ncbi:MAG: hypothetical protein ACLQNE_21145 [Thermoguttaceae bacterium]
MVPANLPELTVTGDVVAVVPGYVRVASSADRTWDLQITPKTKIGVKGKAKADYLAAGDCISFVANVDVRHARVTDEKINKLTLFTPDNRRPLMAIRGGTGLSGMDNKAGEPGNAGAGGGAFAGNPFGGAAAQGDGFGGTEKPSGRKGMASGKKGAKGAAAPESYEIRGEITSIRNGKLTVSVPTDDFKPVLKNVAVAEDAEIEVDLSGPDAILVARKGDKVEAHGRQMSESMGYMDDKLQITLVEPLSAGKVKKKPGAKLEHGAKSKRGKDADSSADEAVQKHKAAKKAKKKAADDDADEPTDKAKPATKEAPAEK